MLVYPNNRATSSRVGENMVRPAPASDLRRGKQYGRGRRRCGCRRYVQEKSADKDVDQVRQAKNDRNEAHTARGK
jgi:hypothetical protein